jgi:hypothetical protein
VKRQEAINVTKLNEVLNNPALEKDHQEVFSFVRTITNGTVKPDDLTDTNIETWNQRFDAVLEQLFSVKTKEEGKEKKQIK